MTADSADSADSQVAPARTKRLRGSPKTLGRTASPQALAAAAAVANRVRNRNAQLRRLFVARTSDVSKPTPLALMMRGGRGGAVRLKLYLSLLWFAANPPYDVTYPARAWAELLDLPDPETTGARRIADAFTWLDRQRFIDTQSRPGLPTRVVLLEESGTGTEYRIPGAAWRALPKDATTDERERQRYVQLSSTLWTTGWMTLLTGPALAMYLVLLAELAGDDPSSRRIWFSPAVADLRYALSEDTRSTGLRELVRVGLVTVKRRSLDTDTFDFRRVRNVYQLNPKALDRTAQVLPSTRGRSFYDNQT